MAASRPAPAHRRSGTGSCGNRAIITVNSSQATRIDTTSDPSRTDPASRSAEVASTPNPMVSRLARKAATRAITSDTLVLRKPGGGNRCPHIWLSAARSRCIHNSPT